MTQVTDGVMTSVTSGTSSRHQAGDTPRLTDANQAEIMSEATIKHRYSGFDPRGNADE